MKSRARVRATRAMTRGVNNEKLLTADSARAVSSASERTARISREMVFAPLRDATPGIDTRAFGSF